MYFDFAKAFDSVNHDIILQKLKYKFKVDGMMLKFISEYLQGRTQRVVIDQMMSSEAPVLFGVPQGSILGPLLFVLFINDMHSVVSPGTSIALYADDTKIWRRINSEVDSEILNKDIESLNKWALANHMIFNQPKCKVVSNTRKNKIFSMLPFYNFPYALSGVLLDHTEYEKDLGVYITEGLSWSLQQDDLLAKATQRFNLLRRTCHFVKNKNHKRTLYLSMVRSLFEHCGCVWAPIATSTTDKFECIQKRAVKWILCEQFYSYSEAYYMQKLIDLDILPMAQRFVQNDLILFFKILKGITPISLPSYVTIRSDTRNAKNCITYGIDNSIAHSPIKNVFGHSFFPRSIASWNSLNPYIKSSSTLATFEKFFTSHLWDVALSNFDSDCDSSWESFDIEPD